MIRVQDIVPRTKNEDRQYDQPRKYRSVLRFFTTLLVICVLLAGGMYVFATAYVPAVVTVELGPDMNRLEVAKAIGRKLGWNDTEQRSFAATYAQLQWAAFNSNVLTIFEDRFAWNDTKLELFSTHSTSYLQPELDFLSTVYAPGTYEIQSKLDEAEIAALLIDRIREAGGTSLNAYISKRIPDSATENLEDFIAQKVIMQPAVDSGFKPEGVALDPNTELLPDLALLPPRDLHVEHSNKGTILRFSSTYYNQGTGPLELRADTKNIGKRKDEQRNVSQRIYKGDGTYRDVVVGNFLWHQEHLHYHFANFIVYDLEAVDAPGAPDLSGKVFKSTYCVRDVSSVDLKLANVPDDASYKICGQRLQGLSVGWGDTYYYTYPDQILNISDLTPGTYRLTFIVNPSQFLEETDLKNNTSSVLFSWDPKKGTVKVLEEDPITSPNVKHVYMD